MNCSPCLCRLFVYLLAAVLAWAAPAGFSALAQENAPAAREPDDAPPRPVPRITEEPAADKDTEEEKTPARSSRSRTAQITRNGGPMIAAFQPVVANAAKATVHVLSSGRQITLGTVVDKSGYVLTKHSELRGNLKCRLFDGREVAAQVVGVHEPTDLALLKVDATRLPDAPFGGDSPTVGSWIITTDAAAEPLTVGIVSVAPRRIPAAQGFMGVTLAEHDPGVRIDTISPRTPADRSDLQVGDVVIDVDGKRADSMPALQDIIRARHPGDTVTLTVLREGKELKIKITLGNMRELNPMFDRSNFQNSMGGTLSERREDFPLAFQHDTILNPRQCGGPVCDLDGNVVGINIAREGRVSSLALPLSVVQPVIEELMSGKLAPAVVNKPRLEEIDRLLSQIELTLAGAPTEIETLKTELDQLNAAEREAEANLQQALKELDRAKESRLRVQLQLESRRSDLSEAGKNKEQLERERERLVTGAR